jgi:nucleoid DNA-binding protein
MRGEIRDVWFWRKADISILNRDVRCAPLNGHSQVDVAAERAPLEMPRGGHPTGPREDSAMLRTQILAAIASQPGISARQLRQQLAPATLRQVHSAINELHKSGEIQRTGFGQYQTRQQRPPAAATVNGIPLARLMAGR